MPRPVFLTGMMAAGKSTVGRLLAEERGGTFVDLDARLECMFGVDIRAVLGRSEAELRRLERLALRSLIDEPAFAARPAVVATGGGTVLDPDNRDAMAEAGVIVFLDVPIAELAARLDADDEVAKRPLLADAEVGPRQRLAELLAARRQAYLDRAVVVDGRGTPVTVMARVREALADEPDRDSRAV